METRTYTSLRRATSAAATRDAVLDAAEHLFSAHGYSITSVAEIARLAEVAPNTVYVSVGGKPELVTALVERKIGPRFQHWEAAQPPRESHDGPAIVQTLVHNVRLTFEPSLDVLRILIDGARADKVILSAEQASRSRYRTILERTSTRLIDSGLLLGRTQAEGADILWYFLRVESWRALQEMKWTWDRSEEWLGEQASRVLFGI
jgi:AcrR family transcriptional regulator